MGEGERVPTREEIERVAEQARGWATSPEGLAAIRRGLAEADEVIARLREARRIDPEDLRRPFCC